MNTATTIAVIALVIVIGGGLYYNYSYPAGDVMMAKGNDLMEDGDKMVKEGQDMLDKGGAMIEEGKKMMFTDENGNTTEMTSDGSADWMQKAPEGQMMSAGSYEAYSPEKLSKATDGDVVLFFRASWCPTCRGLDSDIKAHLGDIPKGVTILDVDYDNSTALKQKYGVTYQHTLVQVDAKGNQIAKWSNSPTLAALVTNIK